MSDYWANKRDLFWHGTNESKVCIDYDAQCLHKDAVDQQNKKGYLMQYRDDNKTVSEIQTCESCDTARSHVT